MKTFYKIFLLLALTLLASNFAFAQTESEKGIELYQNGEYQKAIVSLQKAAETDKKDRDAWLYLGMSFARLKKDGKASSAFSKANKIEEGKPPENEKKVKIISKPSPQYTDQARQNQVQGTIALAVEFGADGKLKFILAFQVLRDGLTENAIAAARKINFEPATKDGKPVSEIALVKYRFTIY